MGKHRVLSCGQMMLIPSQQQMLMQQQLRAQTWAEFRLVLSSAEQLQGWWALVCEHVIAIEIQLNRSTATWMFEHRDALRGVPLIKAGCSFRFISRAMRSWIKRLRMMSVIQAKFAQLGLPVRVSGLPLCLLGNPQQRAKQVPPRQRLRARYLTGTRAVLLCESLLVDTSWSGILPNRSAAEIALSVQNVTVCTSI